MMRIAFIRVCRAALAITFVCLTSHISDGAIVTTGLQVYLNANTLSLNNGDPVSVWNSTGGATVNASQIVVGNETRRPTYITNALNGNSVVRFDGALGGGGNLGDYMNLGQITATTAGPNEGYTAFFVLKTRTDPHPSDTQSGLVRLNNGSGQDTHYRHSSGPIYDGTLNNTRPPSGTPPAGSLDEYHIYSLVSAPNFFQTRFNSDAPFFTTTATTPEVNYPIGSGGNLIGASVSGNVYFDGDFAAILVYNVRLSEADYNETLAALTTEFFTPVPEPTSLTMLAGCAIGLLRVVRKPRG